MWALSHSQRCNIWGWPCGICDLFLLVFLSMRKLPGCPFCFPLPPGFRKSENTPSNCPKTSSAQLEGFCGVTWLGLGVGKVIPTSRVFFLVALFTISKSPVVQKKEKGTYYSGAAVTQHAKMLGSPPWSFKLAISPCTPISQAKQGWTRPEHWWKTAEEHL